jgi:RNA polymerase sigma factor (sigma-70 family)
MTIMKPPSMTDAAYDPEQERTDRAWRAYGPSALRFATVLVGPDDAHDIATSAFLRVTDSTGWVGLDQPQSYLFRAVSNEARNHQRQRSRRWRRDLQAITAHAAVDSPVDVDVIRALSKLTVAQRSVVFLTYWNDMTEAAIAETLGLSTGTVHRTLVRARIQVRKALS